MSDIHSLLGEVYGTAKTAAAAPTSEDMAKQANLEFFNSLVQSRGINIDLLSDDEAVGLYKKAMEFKDKEEGKGKAKEDKDKEDEAKKEASAKIVAAANEELTEKRAAAAKIAEADFLGRTMAHAFAEESQKIAAKLAGEMPPQFGKKPEGKEGKDGKEEESEEDKKKEASVRAAALAAELTKSASGATPNADLVAAEHALVLLKEAGIADDVAFERINAVHTLGLPASAKIATALSNEEAINTRALEYCEAAGFPVNWA